MRVKYTDADGVNLNGYSRVSPSHIYEVITWDHFISCH